MKQNRRNYYRILHVQPEAPESVIRASYRILMGPLGQHPDRGGDHAAAALLNEAWAVLGDPERRRAYDRMLRKERLRGADTAPAPAAGTGRTRNGSVGRESPGSGVRCPFCRHPSGPSAMALSACPQCNCPLTPPPRPDARLRELFGKRSSARLVKDRTIALTADWGEAARMARMCDLSLNGMRLLVPIRVPVGRVVRVVDHGLEAVAEVVASRRTAGGWATHCRFIALRMSGSTGRFVAMQA